jgi:multiple sugar transport system ATP-binding protein
VSGFQESVVQRVFVDALTKVFVRPGGELVRALSELSLGIEDKECVALVGPSGSGKTTALRLIAGLEAPTSGTISIGGTLVNGIAPKHRDVAMVFQSPALYPHMTVYENLGFGLRLRKCPRQEADRRIRDTAAILGLGSLLESLPLALSAGQRQRVALGRAMARRAGVLLLDEPLANVDPGLRAQMRDEIADLRRQLGTTMIYVTHDHLEAMMIGDRVAVLSDGTLQQIAEPQVLYRRPANLFVAGFVGSPPMNLFRGTLAWEAGELFFRAPPAELAAALGSGETFKVGVPARFVPSLGSRTTVVMGLRPEYITCAFGDPQHLTARSIRARLLSVQALGPDLYLRIGSGATVFVARASPPLTCVPGQDYPFGFDMEQACFFDPATGKTILCPGES